VFRLFHNLLNDTLSTALAMLCKTRTWRIRKDLKLSSLFHSILVNQGLRTETIT